MSVTGKQVAGKYGTQPSAVEGHGKVQQRVDELGPMVDLCSSLRAYIACMGGAADVQPEEQRVQGAAHPLSTLQVAMATAGHLSDSFSGDAAFPC